jgi:hypothetical protein
MILLAALLCNYRCGKCLIDIGTEGATSPMQITFGLSAPNSLSIKDWKCSERIARKDLAFHHHGAAITEPNRNYLCSFERLCVG